MPITPRFRQAAASRRPFVDREPILAAFGEEMNRLGAGPRVLNVVGVGGIGKSRLLGELRERGREAARTATLDLHIPALRQHDDALAVLRVELGRQGVRFDRFDIAYAVLWQRLHPHLRLSPRELPFLRDSAILTEIADSVAGVPVFGTAIGLVKIFERTSVDARRRRRIRRDPTLEALDGLANSELADAVTFLFAQDLRDASTDNPYVVVVDTYEAMVPSPIRTGRVQHLDSWLRDLVSQLDRGLVIVASREPLRWEAHDADWSSIVRVCRLDGLPMTARIELLDAGGMAGTPEAAAIASASAGLPFYLNLALDTYQRAGERGGDPLVSPEEILSRFLQHVSADEVSALEILSPARTFDYEIFRALARSFHMPNHRLFWNSLAAYSFVYPAGPDSLRFHQLMRSALLRRLTADVAIDIHRLLQDQWDARARAYAGGAEPADVGRPLREAAYHGVRAGRLSGADLLDYADRAVQRGGNAVVAGMTDDVERWVADQPPAADAPADLADAARCLRAEAAVRLGDAAAVIRLTSGGAWTSPEVIRTAVGGRLAVAAGHGRRIAGDTVTALTIYTAVWETGAGAARLAAGLWAADLHMCQGRFADADLLAVALSELAPDDDRELHGDIARLRHLAARFSFDTDTAWRYLEEAHRSYEAAGSVVGLANIQTNRAELLAVTDPSRAAAEAARALEVQTEIGAHHELGKAYTALAIGQSRDGRLVEAAASFHAAFAALDRAGYRSGRARAELFRALSLARENRFDEAVPALARAVLELEVTGVYPTLILAAAQALSALGLSRDDITAAARRARESIAPIGPLEDIERRCASFVGEILDGQVAAPADLYRQAAGRTERASGFYHHNIAETTPAGRVIVRIPIPGTDTMDLAIWPEPDVLRAIRDLVPTAPRLLYAGGTPPFQIHEFKSGTLLDDRAPRGVRVPDHVLDDVVDLLVGLGRIPAQRLPTMPVGWPEDTRVSEFAGRLSAITVDVHRRFVPAFGDLFRELGIPTDPLAAVTDGWHTLHPRPFRLLHTDIHRKNMIVAGERTWFLDWELALWGDPVYDLAVHLHKMAYQPDEASRVLDGWSSRLPPESTAGWEHDLDIYLAHERIKSAVVDTVRYTKLVGDPATSDAAGDALIDKLVGKLAAAHRVWGSGAGPTRATVAEPVRRWAAEHADS